MDDVSDIPLGPVGLALIVMGFAIVVIQTKPVPGYEGPRSDLVAGLVAAAALAAIAGKARLLEALLGRR